MSIYMVARGAGRSGPVYPRTVSIYSNNYRKLHGMSMMRHVHLRKIQKRKFNRMIDILCRAGNPSSILTPNEIRYVLEHYYHEPVINFELPTCELPEIDSRYYSIYGQPVLDQKAVVKIVTSGEEN